MIAFICLLIPPLVHVYLRERILGRHETVYVSARNYGFSVLALNGAMMLLLFYVFQSEGELLFKLNHHNGFACKYILLSMTLVVAEPFLERFCREKVVLNVRRGSGFAECRYVRGLAGVYALILFLLNFIRIFDNNFWVDEAFTVNLVQRSLPEIITTTAADVHPPLYYLFVKAGYVVFGNQGWMFHLVSLIPCAVILVFSLTVIWKKFGKEAAVIMITLAGLSVNAVNYNVEVRMYSWAALFVLLSFYELYGILSEGRNKNYILFGVYSLAAAYTHYYALISVAFFYLVILLQASRKRLDLKKVLITCAVTIIGYLPWFFILLKTFVTSIDTFWLQGIPGFKESINYVFSDQLNLVAWGLLFGGFLIVVLYESGILQIRKREDGKIAVSAAFDRIAFSDMLVWSLAGILSVVGTIVVGIGVSKLIRPFFLVRYLYPVSVVAWMVLGGMMSRLKGRKIYTVLLIAYMLLMSAPAYRDTYIRQKQMNDLLQVTLAATEGQIAADDVILADHKHIGWHIAPYYYPGITSHAISLYEFPELEKGITYWLFIRISDGVPEMGPVYEEIERQGFSCELIMENGNLGTHAVNIYRIR